jgi:hypothetical protein
MVGFKAHSGDTTQESKKAHDNPVYLGHSTFFATDARHRR